MGSTSIRERIYQYMLHRGVSQVTLCNDLGLQMSNFNAFIRGKRTLPFRDLVSVLKYLHLSIAPVGAEFAIIPPEKMIEVFRNRVKRNGRKVTEIASASGICSSCISSIITGKRMMSTKNLGKLLITLDLEIVPYRKAEIK